MEDFRKSSDQVGLYYQVDSGLFYKVLDVGKGEIEGGGWGFFICSDFAVGQKPSQCMLEQSLLNVRVPFIQSVLAQ